MKNWLTRSVFFIIFFLPTHSKNPCRDPLTKEYTECRLRYCTHFRLIKFAVRLIIHILKMQVLLPMYLLCSVGHTDKTKGTFKLVPFEWYCHPVGLIVKQRIERCPLVVISTSLRKFVYSRVLGGYYLKRAKAMVGWSLAWQIDRYKGKNPDRKKKWVFTF